MSREFTLPAFDEMQRAIARDLVDAFGKDDVRAVYTRASMIAPKLYPAKAKLTNAELDKATDLLADAFLVLGTKRQ